jgi:hypothetical protein
MPLSTRVNGHLISACRAGDGWEVQIDAHLPVMDREWDFRSTYYSASPAIAINAAMSEVLGYAERVW